MQSAIITATWNVAFAHVTMVFMGNCVSVTRRKCRVTVALRKWMFKTVVQTRIQVRFAVAKGFASVGFASASNEPIQMSFSMGSTASAITSRAREMKDWYNNTMKIIIKISFDDIQLYF